MTIKEEILRHSFPHGSEEVWEKFIERNLIKNFPKDIKILGEDYVEVYSTIFGEQNLFEELYENRDAILEILNEDVAPSKAGTGASIGEILRRIKTSTEEAKGLAASQSLSGRLETAKKNLGAGITTAGVAAGGFFSRIAALLTRGFSWVKDLVTQGVSWIASNPIAKIAAPIIAITGSVALAAKLINKIRNKKKMRELSASEKETLEKLAEKDRAKIEEYKRAMKVK